MNYKEILILNNISKKYSSKNIKEFNALRGINLSFNNRGFYTILGKSGCGKTTLLNIISLIDNDYSGEYCFCKTNVSTFNNLEIDSFHNKDVGIIFQDDFLINEFNVYKNISLVLELRNVAKNAIFDLVVSVLEELEIKHLMYKRINELSGGERQRVCIARALIKKPLFLIADEPTGNLDSESSDIVFSIFKKISKKRLVIVVSHDKVMAEEFADTIINMKDGRVESIKKNKTNIASKIELIRKTEKTRLSFKNTLFFTYKSLISSKFRLMLTTLTILLSLSLLLFVSFLYLFKIDNSIYSYVKENNLSHLNCFQESSYDISNDTSYDENIYIGKQMINKFEEDRISYNKIFEKEVKASSTINSYIMNYKDDFELDLLIGDYPTQNEILLSDYLYEKLFLFSPLIDYEGKTLEISDGIVLNISGVYKTTYHESIGQYNTGYFDFLKRYHYTNSFVSNTNYFMVEENILLPNILASSPQEGIDNKITYSGTNAFPILKEGRLPISYNEVVIKEETLLLFNYLLTDPWEEFHYKTDFNNPNYNGVFNNYLNFFDYYSDITVVGVYSQLGNEEFESDVYFNDSAFDVIVNDYNEYYNFDHTMIYNITKSDIASLCDSDFLFLHPDISIIYSFVDNSSSFKNVVLIIFYISAILSIAMLANYIIFSVVSHKKDIGLLRSLGTSEYNINKIYYFEGFIIVNMSLVIAFCISSYFLNATNKNYYSSFISKFDILYISYSFILFIIIIINVLNILSVVIPVRYLKKKQISSIMK